LLKDKDEGRISYFANQQLTIINHQSTIINHQSSINHHQSSIKLLHSAEVLPIFQSSPSTGYLESSASRGED